MTRVILCIAISILLAVGCGVVSRPSIRVVEGHLISPSGKYEFERDSGQFVERYNGDGMVASTVVLAEGDGIAVVARPHSSRTLLKLVVWPSKKRLSYEQGEGFYYHGDKKWPLKLETSQGYQRSDISVSEDVLIAEVRGLQSSIPSSYTLGLYSPELRKNSKVEYDKKFRLYLPFSLDGEQYLIDLTTEYKSNSTIVFYEPGPH